MRFKIIITLLGGFLFFVCSLFDEKISPELAVDKDFQKPYNQRGTAIVYIESDKEIYETMIINNNFKLLFTSDKRLAPRQKQTH